MVTISRAKIELDWPVGNESQGDSTSIRRVFEGGEAWLWLEIGKRKRRGDR